MKSLLNAFTKKEGKEKAFGRVELGKQQFLADSPGGGGVGGHWFFSELLALPSLRGRE